MNDAAHIDQDTLADLADTTALLATCRHLEAAIGAHFIESSGEVGLGDEATVHRLAEISGLRARRVLLDGRWWEGASGAILARLEHRPVDDGSEITAVENSGSDHCWIALAPGRFGGYRIYSAIPLRGIPQGSEVTGAIAAQLSAFGYSFSRGFPRHPLSLLETVRFGMRDSLPDLILLLLCSLLAGLLGLLAPVVSGALVEHVIPAHDIGRVWQFIFALALAGLSATLFDFVRSIAVLRIEARAGVGIQAALLDRIIALPAQFFRQHSSGDLATRIAAVNTLQQAITGSTVGTLLTSIFLLGNLVIMLYFSKPMTLAVLAAIIPLLVVSMLIMRARLRVARRIEEGAGKLHALVFQILSGIAKVRTSASEERAYQRWFGLFDALRGQHLKSEALGNLESMLGGLLYPVALVFAFGVLAQGLAGHHTPGPGDFIAFNAALFNLLGGIAALIATINGLVHLRPLWERVRIMVETLPETGAATGMRHLPQGQISIAGVYFAYGSGGAVLSGLELHIRPGEFVAIVGPSGSGKSTLVRLLLGFESPGAGTIHYDGHDLATLDLRSLRRAIGTVLQDGRLWAGDLYTNIVGVSNLPIEAAWDAADAAGLRADIEAMPMGMYTVVGEGSSTLSGGQRQRVMIARALVHRPRLLFLDEATSALDNRTQETVMSSLAGLEATRIVIAHRLNTIRKADRIIVMERGKIVQQGCYDELAAQPGVFANLLKRQLN